VVAPNAEASDLHNLAPTYPQQSRRLGEQGRVVLSVLVLANGTIGALSIKRSSGFKRLDKAALHCVKRWRFKPATRAGVALDFTYELPIDFSLN
jgi:periplasmic protein TonB